MWHKDHIDPFFDRLIQYAVAYLDINPNRVYLLGYSAGGDGAYQMAPRMADRWAASGMMAGYPNDASPINLRNTAFSIHVGEHDTAYGRSTIAVTYGNQIQALQEQDPRFYNYEVKVHEGRAHWMDGDDAIALDWMDNFTRNPNPKKIVWHQDSTVTTNSFPPKRSIFSPPPDPFVPGISTQNQFYWIGIDKGDSERPFALVTAEIIGQEIHIKNSNKNHLHIYLNDTLINLDLPISIFWEETKIFEGSVSRTILNQYNSMKQRRDREYIYSASLNISNQGVANQSHSLKQLPNPIVHTIGNYLNISSPIATGTIHIRNLLGNTVLKRNFHHQNQLNFHFGHREKGVYILSIAGEGQVISQKFLHK